MAIKDAFVAELKHETSLTKKILERVPMEKKDWRLTSEIFCHLHRPKCKLMTCTSNLK